MGSGKRASVVFIVASMLATTVVLAAAPPPVSAQFPGVNGRIAYVRETDPAALPGSPNYGLSDIYVVNADGTDAVKLNATPKQYGQLDWAADGSKLAIEVAGGTAEAPITEIWTIRADGSDEHKVSGPHSRYNPSWSPDGRYLAVDNSVEVLRIDSQTGHEVLLFDDDKETVTCQGGEFNLPFGYRDPAWSPAGGQIAVTRWQERPPVGEGGVGGCDPNPFFDLDIAIGQSGGGQPAQIIDDRTVDLRPDWSPDGNKLVWQRGGETSPGVFSDFGIVTAFTGGGGLTRLIGPGSGARPKWSPDGSRIVFSRDENQDGNADVWTMSSVNGGTRQKVVQDNRFNAFPDWQPIDPGGLDVTLAAFALDGTPLEGIVAPSSLATIELRIENTSETDVEGFEFAQDLPLVVDERAGTEATLVSGPEPAFDPDLVLEPAEEITYTFEVRFEFEPEVDDGIAGAHTKATAHDENGVPVGDHHSLKFIVADGMTMDAALTEWAAMQAMDATVVSTYSDWYKGMTKRGNRLFKELSDVLSPAKRKKWFGSATGLVLQPIHYAEALLRGTAPKMFAASFPLKGLGDVSYEDMKLAYDRTFKAELGEGVKEYVNGYAGLAGSAKKVLQDSYSEALLTSMWFFGTATPEERMQVEAYMYNLASGTDTSVDNAVNMVTRELPQWKENGTYFLEAIKTSISDVLLQSPDLQAAIAQEEKWRENMLRQADKDPIKFQEEWAKRDAEIAKVAIPIIMDTLIGGGVSRITAGATKLVVRGKGAAVIRTGEAAGALDDAGRVVETKGLKNVDVADSAAPHSPTAQDQVRIGQEKSWLDDVEDATIVQSTDAGAVYELPNLAGVPEVTLEAKAGILAELEQEFFKRFGRQIKIAELLKPSSAYRKAKGVAKLELTPQKTGKAAMLDANAPPEILGEANVWRSDVHPARKPGFNELSKARQEAALNEWDLAAERWAEWQNPAPGSKTARLKECIGQRKEVPLDDAPVNGTQRFVEAEFETVHIKGPDSEAILIRVKHYEVKVKVNGKVVDSKVVVNNLEEAVPQTPDADAAGLGKVVGETPDGKPILEPFNQQERDFLMKRYIDKNIKARKKKPGTKGAMPDAAEHGATLNISDAVSWVAGKLIAQFGAPFLPEVAGLNHIRRIAPHVAKHLIPEGATAAEAAKIIEDTRKKLVQIVRDGGGFGQEVVVVTSDSRYFGELEVNFW